MKPKSLSLKKYNVIAICLILIIASCSAIWFIHQHFNGLIDQTTDFRSKNIETTFMQQNGHYLSKDHLNFLKLNLNQQLRYSSLDYIGIWDNNLHEIIKVGDGGLSSKIQTLLLKDKTQFRISHLDETYHIGKKILPNSDYTNLKYYIYAYNLASRIQEFKHSKMVIIGIIGLLLWISFIALIILYHSWRSTIMAELNRPIKNANSLGIIRQVIKYLTRDLGGAVEKIQSLQLTDEDAPFSKEKLDLHYQDLLLKNKHFLSIAKNAELTSITTSLTIGNISLRTLLFNGLNLMVKESNLTTSQKRAWKTSFTALDHPMILSNSSEVKKVMDIVFQIFGRYHDFDEAFQVLVEPHRQVKNSWVNATITGKMQVQTLEEMDSSFLLKLFIAENICELLQIKMTKEFKEKTLTLSFRFLASKTEDTTALPENGIWKTSPNFI